MVVEEEEEEEEEEEGGGKKDGREGGWGPRGGGRKETKRGGPRIRASQKQGEAGEKKKESKKEARTMGVGVSIGPCVLELACFAGHYLRCPRPAVLPHFCRSLALPPSLSPLFFPPLYLCGWFYWLAGQLLNRLGKEGGLSLLTLDNLTSIFTCSEERREGRRQGRREGGEQGLDPPTSS